MVLTKLGMVMRFRNVDKLRMLYGSAGDVMAKMSMFLTKLGMVMVWLGMLWLSRGWCDCVDDIYS
jgi:hypothetical protein